MNKCKNKRTGKIYTIDGILSTNFPHEYNKVLLRDDKDKCRTIDEDTFNIRYEREIIDAT